MRSMGRETTRSVVEGQLEQVCAITPPPGFAWSPSPSELGEDFHLAISHTKATVPITIRYQAKGAKP
jgi:hypothetical protein